MFLISYCRFTIFKYLLENKSLLNLRGQQHIGTIQKQLWSPVCLPDIFKPIFLQIFQVLNLKKKSWTYPLSAFLMAYHLNSMLRVKLPNLSVMLNFYAFQVIQDSRSKKYWPTLLLISTISCLFSKFHYKLPSFYKLYRWAKFYSVWIVSNFKIFVYSQPMYFRIWLVSLFLA